MWLGKSTVAVLTIYLFLKCLRNNGCAWVPGGTPTEAPTEVHILQKNLAPAVNCVYVIVDSS